MAVVEKTTIGFGSRLGSSLKGIFTGLLMVLAGIVLLWWNEGRSVRRYKALKEGAAAVISISADQVLPENEGKLVHLTAPAVTQETLQDSEFGLSLPGALRLERKVEMYQWQEDSETKEEEKLGGKVEKTTTYTYEKVWSSTPIDSRNFKEAGHENPARSPIPEKTILPARVTVGAFRLTPEQIQKVGGARELALAPDYQVPENLPALLPLYQTPRISSQEIYFPVKKGNAPEGDAPAGENTPEIGDLRVSFQVVDSHDISLVYVQKGDSFAVYQAKTGTVALQADGIKTADEMFTSAQSANKVMTWLLRLVGFFLIFSGFQAIFKPIQVLASVIPFLGRMVGAGTSTISFLLALPISLLVISLAWLFYRPVLAVVLLVAMAASLYGLKTAFAKLKKPEAPVQA